MQTEAANKLSGFYVVSLEEGKFQGTLKNLYIDKKNSKLASCIFKESILDTEKIAKVENIVKIGSDVIFVESLANIEKVEEKNQPPGTRFKDLIGMNVCTLAGEKIGYLTDVEFDFQSWRITELILNDNSVIEIGQNNITMGKDEILIPEEIGNVRKKIESKHSGFFRHFLGREAMENLNATMHRIVNSFKRDSKAESSEKESGKIDSK